MPTEPAAGPPSDTPGAPATTTAASAPFDAAASASVAPDAPSTDRSRPAGAMSAAGCAVSSEPVPSPGSFIETASAGASSASGTGALSLPLAGDPAPSVWPWAIWMEAESCRAGPCGRSGCAEAAAAAVVESFNSSSRSARRIGVIRHIRKGHRSRMPFRSWAQHLTGAYLQPPAISQGEPDRRAGLTMERVTGIEPAQPAWKAGTLPLSYTRAGPV